MAKAKSATSNKSTDNSANLGFEAKLWLAADKLRNNMDAAEYKHVVLGLIFLKYISETFDEHHAKLVEGKGDYAGANPEDKDEYLAANVFWVPKEARWPQLQAKAKLPSIGKDVDDAMVALERDNPRLKGALNKNYGRADLDKHRLGELIDLIGSITLADAASRAKDVLGRVFEYFLTQFASAEGKNGGQFYTPSCVVRLLVEMLAPYKGRIYDPCCGSGGMFIQSEKFVEAHGGQLGDISIYGQESNPTTRRLAIMNLALRGIEADFGPENADTFRRDLHPDLRADYVLANPPFNDSDWFRKDDDVRWQYGVPPKGTRYQRDITDTQIRDGLIQRFELTYELAHKTLKRFLENVSPTPDEYNHADFSYLIRSANEQGLLLKDWPAWKGYRDMRTKTSHTYDEETALEVVAGIAPFLDEARFLRDQLQSRLA